MTIEKTKAAYIEARAAYYAANDAAYDAHDAVLAAKPADIDAAMDAWAAASAAARNLHAKAKAAYVAYAADAAADKALA